MQLDSARRQQHYSTPPTPLLTPPSSTHPLHHLKNITQPCIKVVFHPNLISTFINTTSNDHSRTPGPQTLHPSTPPQQQPRLRPRGPPQPFSSRKMRLAGHQPTSHHQNRRYYRLHRWTSRPWRSHWSTYTTESWNSSTRLWSKTWLQSLFQARWWLFYFRRENVFVIKLSVCCWAGLVLGMAWGWRVPVRLVTSDSRVRLFHWINWVESRSCHCPNFQISTCQVGNFKNLQERRSPRRKERLHYLPHWLYTRIPIFPPALSPWSLQLSRKWLGVRLPAQLRPRFC